MLSKDKFMGSGCEQCSIITSAQAQNSGIQESLAPGQMSLFPAHSQKDLPANSFPLLAYKQLLLDPHANACCASAR